MRMSNPELGGYKGNVGSCPQVSMFLSAGTPGFCLVLDPTCKLGEGWECLRGI